MPNRTSIPQTDDERARFSALRYAAAVMHFVRRIRGELNELDPSQSHFERLIDFDPSHLGAAPIGADVKAHQLLEQVVHDCPLHQNLGETIILGEEAAPAYRKIDDDQPQAIVRCDPIDGTGNMSHCGDGFSTVVTIEHKPARRKDWRHLAGAIVRHDGDAISWSARGVFRHDVVIDFRRIDYRGTLPRIIDRAQIPHFDDWELTDDWRAKLVESGAVVAATSKRRRDELLAQYSELIRRSEFFDFRSGSTSVWGLCNRRLGFVLETSATTIHDSAHLIPFQRLGGRVVDHSYKELRIKNLVARYAEPGAPDKPIPAYIAYVDESSLEFVQDCLSEKSKERRRPAQLLPPKPVD